MGNFNYFQIKKLIYNILVVFSINIIFEPLLKR